MPFFSPAKRKWDGIPPITILDRPFLYNDLQTNSKIFSPDQMLHAWDIAAIYTYKWQHFYWQKLPVVML